ncbi:hypothetical protein NQ317_010177 [Molorchus minor]|uniref:Peptidase aspartic putative domain-containing protein n=1 Tax=Molorchus minor TaxID=1323400 RepID=A0ABQ9IPM1_9CUCU|nr:hypothetical protein NQ317_010177 [Molorchus minor]
MSLEERKRLRKVLRMCFTKACTELEGLLNEPQPNLEKIQVSNDVLLEKADELKNTSAEIFELMLAADTSEEDLAAERDGSDAYLVKSKTLDLRCQKLLKKERNEVLNDVSSVVSSTPPQGKRKFKLPVIQFKQFDGNIREWLSFWAQFRKIDEDPDIDLADKVEYLVQTTVPGSRARQIVNSFPATGENYAKIVDSLKNTFRQRGPANRESCLPEDLLRVWQRSATSLCTEASTVIEMNDQGSVVSTGGEGSISLDIRLKALMQFLRNEVENEQRILLAAEGIGLSNIQSSEVGSGSGKHKFLKHRTGEGSPSTAADLLNSTSLGNKCIFCDGMHESGSCYKARTFTYDKKKKLIAEKKACFCCLKIGHLHRKCRTRVICLVCGKRHVVLMCPEVKSNKRPELQERSSEEQNIPSLSTANYTSTHVFLQTLKVRLVGRDGVREVRALIDSGSQRSYVLQSTAVELGLSSKSKEKVLHCLFGGILSEQKHTCFEVIIAQNNYSCKFDALDQPKICSDVSPVFPGPWTEELKALNIELHDVGNVAAIELLIGSDVAGKLYTGRRHELSCGLVAMETRLGWTLMGKILSSQYEQKMSTSAISLFVHDSSISNLWELDVLGITEPTADKTRHELEAAAEQFFMETVKVDKNGRFEITLPWLRASTTAQQLRYCPNSTRQNFNETRKRGPF